MRRGALRHVAYVLCASLLASANAGRAASADDAPRISELQGVLDARIRAEVDAVPGSIRIAEREGRVLLRGEVMLLEHSLRAEQIAWKTPGVVDVDNELRVVPASPGADGEIESRVRTIIKAEGRFVDTTLQVGVQAGVVTLQGLFQDPADVLALKHRVASIPGVVDVRIEALLVASSPETPVPPLRGFAFFDPTS